MTKKLFILSGSAFVLGLFIMWLMVFTVDDIRGYVPSSLTPLSDEEFNMVQAEGIAVFNGTPIEVGVVSDNVDVQIRCRKDNELCTVGMASILQYTSGPYLENTLTDYAISEWSDEGAITATHVAECGTSEIRAFVRSREAYIKYTPSESTEENCAYAENGAVNEWSISGMERGAFLRTVKADLHYYFNEAIGNVTTF